MKEVEKPLMNEENVVCKIFKEINTNATFLNPAAPIRKDLILSPASPNGEPHECGELNISTELITEQHSK